MSPLKLAFRLEFVEWAPKLRLVSPRTSVVDTVGGDIAAKLIAKVRQGGSFGAVLADHFS
jgi:hypothetical protein